MTNQRDTAPPRAPPPHAAAKAITADDVEAPRLRITLPSTRPPPEGLDELIDLLTDLWADEIIAAARGGTLTAPIEGAVMVSEAEPPQRANAATAPDPHRVETRAG